MKKARLFLLPVLIFIVLLPFMASTAKATEATEESKIVTIFFNNIKLLLDGKQIAVKNDKGATAEPFILDGVVYIPARTVIDQLKSTGGYNKKYASYFVGKPTTKPVKWISLYEKPYIATSDASRFKATEDKGIQYLGGSINTHTEIKNDRYEGVWDVTYALNGVAQKVSGTICKTSTNNNAYEVIYEFYDDNNKLLYRSPIMTHNVAETDFEFDTGKALKLQMKITLRSSSYFGTTTGYVKNLCAYTTDY